MKDFMVYYCRNEHLNYVEVGKERYNCNICGSRITRINGVFVKGEDEDELSRESSDDSGSESFLSARVTGN